MTITEYIEHVLSSVIAGVEGAQKRAQDSDSSATVNPTVQVDKDYKPDGLAMSYKISDSCSLISFDIGIGAPLDGNPITTQVDGKSNIRVTFTVPVSIPGATQ